MLVKNSLVITYPYLLYIINAPPTTTLLHNCGKLYTREKLKKLNVKP